MNRPVPTALIFSLFSVAACTPGSYPLGSLKEDIQTTLAVPDAHFAVAFKDLQTGKTFLLNEKDNFHAASTMKTPVLVELFQQASEGKFALTDSIPVKNSFSSIADGSLFSLDPADDSEHELYKNIGQKRTIASLAYDMIISSSNLATNLLIELVKADSVMATLQNIGAYNMNVLRGVEDGKAYEKGLNNTTTAFDLLLIFEQMAKGQLVDAGASMEMIRILQDQRFNEIIPACLPPGVKVAHKTGSITGVQHDSGIVFMPDGRKYVLVLLSRFSPSDNKKVVNAMAETSRLVYEYMSKQ